VAIAAIEIAIFCV